MKYKACGKSRGLLRLFLSVVLLSVGAISVCPAADPAVASPPTENYPWMSIARWRNIHESFVKRAKEGKIDIVFMGDSITEQWRANAVWKKYYAPLHAVNFGIGGDLAQNVLWRVTNGEVISRTTDRKGIEPKVVVLLIGTNNTGGNRPKDTARGITAIVKVLQKKLPATKVLLLGVLPRGPEPKTPLRENIAAINASIQKLDDGKMVRYLDIGPKLMDKDGKLPQDVSPDSLHLSEKGYQIWAEAMEPLLKEMMGGNN